MKLLWIRPSSKPEKKFTAAFWDGTKVRFRHFGQRGAKDFVVWSGIDRELARVRRRAYLQRHAKERWTDPTTPAALSRWVLWERPSLQAAIAGFKKRFRL